MDYKNKYTKWNFIELIESYTTLFYFMYLLFSFIFWNLLMLIILYQRIFRWKRYDFFLKFIKDLRDEDKRIKELNSLEEEKKDIVDYTSDEMELEYDEIEINEKEDEYENDEREKYVLDYIRHWFMSIYIWYWLSMFWTFHFIWWEENIMFYLLFSLFIWYCILYKYLFKLIYGFRY